HHRLTHQPNPTLIPYTPLFRSKKQLDELRKVHEKAKAEAEKKASAQAKTPPPVTKAPPPAEAVATAPAAQPPMKDSSARDALRRSEERRVGKECSARRARET